MDDGDDDDKREHVSADSRGHAAAAAAACIHGTRAVGRLVSTVRGTGIPEKLRCDAEILFIR